MFFHWFEKVLLRNIAKKNAKAINEHQVDIVNTIKKIQDLEKTNKVENLTDAYHMIDKLNDKYPFLYWHGTIPRLRGTVGMKLATKLNVQKTNDSFVSPKR